MSASETPREVRTGRGPLLRWLSSYAAFGVPHAAAPIAFALLVLPVTGNADDGAALVLAMTAAQIVGAVPVARLGRRWRSTAFLRVLIGFRTLALITLAFAAAVKLPFWLLIVLAVAAGTVNGAAYGHLRAILNHLVSPDKLPRTLGIAATLNEVTFVLSPVIAAGLGAASPLAAVLITALLGAAPLALVPAVTQPVQPEPNSTPARPGSRLRPATVLWLCCSAVTAAVVAGIEIAAVSMALRFGLAPEAGAIFTVALCIASVAGGVWVSIANRQAPVWAVAGYLAFTAIGAVLVALGIGIVPTLTGAIMIGLVLAPLGTHYSLTLDRITPPAQRAEVFALLRTAGAIGIIAFSGIFSAGSLELATRISAAAVIGACAIVTAAAVLSVRRRRRDVLESASGDGAS